MTDVLKSIKSHFTNEVIGRGIIKSVWLEQGPFAIGDELLIDDVKYIITGIEMGRGLHGFGKHVGLVVRILK